MEMICHLNLKNKYKIQIVGRMKGVLFNTNYALKLSSIFNGTLYGIYPHVVLLETCTDISITF